MFVVVVVVVVVFFRRHSEIQTEAERKIAALESRLEASIRKYETQLHVVQTENERLRNELSSRLQGASPLLSSPLLIPPSRCPLLSSLLSSLLSPLFSLFRRASVTPPDFLLSVFPSPSLRKLILGTLKIIIIIHLIVFLSF